MKTKEWPVLKSYDKEHLVKIAMSIGGIGIGTIFLGGRGDLRETFSIKNRCKCKFDDNSQLFAGDKINFNT